MRFFRVKEEELSGFEKLDVENDRLIRGSYRDDHILHILRRTLCHAADSFCRSITLLYTLINSSSDVPKSSRYSTSNLLPHVSYRHNLMEFKYRQQKKVLPS